MAIFRAFCPFWREKCLNCGERFSFFQDLMRNHDMCGIRIATCRKCQTKHFRGFSEDLSLVHPYTGTNQGVWEHESSNRIVFPVILVTSIVVAIYSILQPLFGWPHLQTILNHIVGPMRSPN
ncbi:hypothetical protein CEB3_c19080 [Peptococcaceae bacterium CEB3]|nr:hypothetical protein CEB3_c19080 [Peptococcaceae bacterium CEB3]